MMVANHDHTSSFSQKKSATLQNKPHYQDDEAAAPRKREGLFLSFKFRLKEDQNYNTFQTYLARAKDTEQNSKRKTKK